MKLATMSLLRLRVGDGEARNVPLFGFLCACLACAFSICELPAQAGPEKGGYPEVDTTWPGVRFQIFRIERIPPNRLVVAVRILATEKAPASGTFLGTRTPPPAEASREDISMGLYDPNPFSLASSVMIDEQTGQRYPVLPSIAPPGRKYLPSSILASLMPGQAELLTVQFAAPPSLPGGESEKQTATFLFPNSKGPIAKVPLPSAQSGDESAGRGG